MFLGWVSPQVPAERLVSFLVSFMCMYLRPSPSTTALGAGSIDRHGRPWTVIPHPEKRKVAARILLTPVLTTTLDGPGCRRNQSPVTRAQPGPDVGGRRRRTNVISLVMRRSLVCRA